MVNSLITKNLLVIFGCQSYSRQSARASGDDEDRLRRHRQIHEPEILSDNDEKGMSVSDDS